MHNAGQARPIKVRNRSASNNAVSGNSVSGIAERLFMVAAKLEDSEERDRGRQDHKERWKS